MGCNLRDLAVIEPLEMSDLSGQRVAVDTFLNAYQFITSLTGEDGKPLSYNGKPVAHLMGFLDRTTVMLSEGIDPVYVFDGRPHELKRETLKGRRERKTEAVSRWEAAVEAGDMTAAKKLGPQTAEYTREMVTETKRLFELLGVTWVEAPMEAEGAAAVRCASQSTSSIGTSVSRCAPTLAAYRSCSSASAPPSERTVTSPPSASMICTASSTAHSS